MHSLISNPEAMILLKFGIIKIGVLPVLLLSLSSCEEKEDLRLCKFQFKNENYTSNIVECITYGNNNLDIDSNSKTDWYLDISTESKYIRLIIKVNGSERSYVSNNSLISRSGKKVTFETVLQYWQFTSLIDSGSIAGECTCL